MNKIKKSKKGIPQHHENRHYEEYYSPTTGKYELLSDNIIEKLIKELIEYAQEPSGIAKVSHFIMKKGIPLRTYFSWLEKFPKLKEAHDMAMQTIADYREFSALKANNSTVVYNSLLMLGDDWRQFHEWKQALNAKNTQPGTTSIPTCIMPAIPSCPSVPERPKDDE
jgi:hypothetical protein